VVGPLTKQGVGLTKLRKVRASQTFIGERSDVEPAKLDKLVTGGIVIASHNILELAAGWREKSNFLGYLPEVFRIAVKNAIGDNRSVRRLLVEIIVDVGAEPRVAGHGGKCEFTVPETSQDVASVPSSPRTESTLNRVRSGFCAVSKRPDTFMPPVRRLSPKSAFTV